MKATVINATSGLLNTPAGKIWPSRATREIEIEKDLLEYRVSLGLYEVVKTAEPPKKKVTSRKKRVVARSTPGKKPVLADMLK